MKGVVMSIVASFLLVASSSLLAQQSGNSPKIAPVVEVSPDGQHTLRLMPRQQAAVDAFLKANPGLLPANCNTLTLKPEDCKTAYNEWDESVRNAKAPVQFPYVIWGDFNGDGVLDFAMPFFSRSSVNNWGWRTWKITVFQGTRAGDFKPVVALTGKWGACFDGMLYHPVRKQIEFWCNSMGGTIKWNGSTFVGKLIPGD